MAQDLKRPQDGYVRFPHRLFMCKELNPSAISVYLWLSYASVDEDGMVMATVPRSWLSEQSGLSLSTLQRSIRELEGGDHIRIVKSSGPKTTATYELVDLCIRRFKP